MNNDKHLILHKLLIQNCVVKFVPSTYSSFLRSDFEENGVRRDHLVRAIFYFVVILGFSVMYIHF